MSKYDFYTKENFIDEINKLNQEIVNLRNQVKNERDMVDSLGFRIKDELEPRLRREAASYDAWVSCDRSAEDCDGFDYHVGALEDYVDAHPEWDWGDGAGRADLAEKILYLIQNKQMAVIVPQEDKK